MGNRKRSGLLPAETSEQLRARLRRFAVANRDDARQAGTLPFPERVTVLAGPLRRIQGPSGAGSRAPPEADSACDESET